MQSSCKWQCSIYLGWQDITETRDLINALEVEKKKR